MYCWAFHHKRNGDEVCGPSWILYDEGQISLADSQGEIKIEGMSISSKTAAARRGEISSRTGQTRRIRISIKLAIIVKQRRVVTQPASNRNIYNNLFGYACLSDMVGSFIIAPKVRSIGSDESRTNGEKIVEELVSLRTGTGRLADRRTCATDSRRESIIEGEGQVLGRQAEDLGEKDQRERNLACTLAECEVFGVLFHVSELSIERMGPENLAPQ